MKNVENLGIQIPNYKISNKYIILNMEIGFYDLNDLRYYSREHQTIAHDVKRGVE